MHKITLILGDGIGPEVAEAARRCVDATGVQIDWDVQDSGAKVSEKDGDPLPARVLDSIRKNKVALKAPVTTPLGEGFRSVNVRLRQELDLFACVRPCRTLHGLKNAVEGVDIVIFRENTEDLYAGIEYTAGSDDTKKLIEFIGDTKGKKIRSDSAVSIKPISKYASERIVESAFYFAESNNRKKVTGVTKSNIMKESDGLFMYVAKEVAKRHKIPYDHVLVDALCMKLVQNPLQFDVLVLPNLYGDIVSDLCAGLTGGLGIAPGANIGDEYAVFEAVHGSAPDIAGKGLANPTAMVLSAAMMLNHIGEINAGKKLESAVEEVISEGKKLTCDLNPTSPVKTNEMTAEIIRKIR
ncbi:MAG: isocitrate/isopropylmalate dehydrogenase family protein [Candidatus Altiarchaeota archaeon]|nr:isocitrate/isopropylmalate dehydrogenase family protein [Candidatus Altiarchaeota archaeon]